MRVVHRNHFGSRNKDGGHTIRFAVGENSMLLAYCIALCIKYVQFEYKKYSIHGTKWSVFVSV